LAFVTNFAYTGAIKSGSGMRGRVHRAIRI
jgi:hypothetical protein